MRGGFWRNFKVKYPEANEMYSRMMMVSRRFAEVEQQEANGEQLDRARRALYRGQCNCPYWHGAFGGIYLPHLRNAVYNHLIAADNLLDQATGKTDAWIEATVDDFNFDARQEVRLANDQLICLLAPAAGGQMYELDVRSICHNLLATLARRPEAYHRKVLAGAHRPRARMWPAFTIAWSSSRKGSTSGCNTTRICARACSTTSTAWTPTWRPCGTDMPSSRAISWAAPYETRIRRNPDRIQVLLSREGRASGVPVKITKGLTPEAGSSTLEIAYLLEGLPTDRPLHFGVEFNFAGLPPTPTTGTSTRETTRDSARCTPSWT